MTWTEYRDFLITDLAKRIYDVDPFEAQAADETPETIAERLNSDPLTVVIELVDYIEQLQA